MLTVAAVSRQDDAVRSSLLEREPNRDALRASRPRRTTTGRALSRQRAQAAFARHRRRASRNRNGALSSSQRSCPSDRRVGQVGRPHAGSRRAGHRGFDRVSYGASRRRNRRRPGPIRRASRHRAPTRRAFFPSIRSPLRFPPRAPRRLVAGRSGRRKIYVVISTSSIIPRAGNRWRQQPLLLAGRPVGRLRRWWKAEESDARRRDTADHCRGNEAADSFAVGNWESDETIALHPRLALASGGYPAPVAPRGRYNLDGGWQRSPLAAALAWRTNAVVHGGTAADSQSTSRRSKRVSAASRQRLGTRYLPTGHLA